MSHSLEFIATIQNGHIVPPAMYASFMRANNGKQLHVKVSENVKKRSLKQNSFWFGCVIPAVVDLFREHGTAISPEQAHEWIKADIVRHYEYIKSPDGTSRSVLKSSAKWTTKEACEAAERVRAWASQYGVIIPMPGESLEEAKI